MVIKAGRLRDSPPAGERDGLLAQFIGQRMVHNSNRPEVHELLRRWRATADGYDPPRVLLGETVVHDPGSLARFYGSGDELHLALNVPFIYSALDAAAL